MSLIAGLLSGAAIAVIEVVARYARLETPRITLSFNDSSLVVPFVLIPVALLLGWTWAAERWAGRSMPRLLLFTGGLYAALGLAVPLDALAATSFDLTAVASELATSAAPLLTQLFIFALPVVIAAPLYWLFGSGRLPTNRFTLGVGYVLGPSLALLSPVATMGAVAGTAAAHAWRSPNARHAIALLAVGLLLAVAFGIPFVLAQMGVAIPTTRPLLLP